MVIEWGTLIYQLIFLLIIIGVPIAVLVWCVKGRNRKNSKIEELEQRIEKLERECNCD